MFISLLSLLTQPGFIFAKEQALFESFRLEQPRQRQLAPSVKGRGLDKRVHELADYKGKLVLLHFWASFCLPCLDELPQLQSMWRERHAEGLEVLSIALDRGSTSAVSETVDKLAISFPVIIENQFKIRGQYEIYAMPMTYLISRDGRIIGRVVGARDWQSDAAQHVISGLLNE